MKNKGFTLLELLVVIVIVGLLALFAAPNFQRLIENQKGREAYQLWQSSFFLAQREAMRLKHKVVLCPSNAEGSDCTDKKVSDYRYGWLVLDQSLPGKPVLQDVPINILKDKTVIALNGSATIEFNPNGRLKSQPRSLFVCINNRNGYKLPASLADENLNCKVENSYDGRKISISAGGRISLTGISDKD